MKLSDLELLIPTPPPPADLAHFWATVTATAPLRVRLDGDPTSLATTPVDLAGNLVIGTRVRVALDAGQLYVTHRANPSIETIPLTVIAGAGAYTPSVHRNPATGEVWLSGGFTMAASGANPAVEYNTGTVVAQLPAGWRPGKTIAASAGPYGAYYAIFAGVRALANGDIETYVNNRLDSGTTGGVVPFTGLRFFAAN